jgi:hypothetical protein
MQTNLKRIKHLHLLCLQEAVAHTFWAEGDADDIVQILRGIRMGSVVHGRPEAIPLWYDHPQFPKTTAPEDPCRASVVWTCDTMYRRVARSPIYALTHNMWGLRTQSFAKPTTRAFALEALQLKLVLAEVGTRLTRNVEYAPTLMEIERVVRAAVTNGEPVLVRKWMKMPWHS